MKFISEGENEFSDNFLPTLDFSTHVKKTGYVEYKFYSKPMASNVLLMRGTALSKSCIFSSMRQELVRRLLNTDYNMGPTLRVDIINKFIQLAVNSNRY